ncbi:hypothetical protein SLEP1_g3266 [Rubroshorea leprosula]|uniref:Retrovirus-related Pol polyprotein from transposon RE1 n=1 Tax=Rubroshorea leprosula TaxID=152421 RepID=A0AAV5HUF0_9ROSI|nr:hypothetical protein SLEP1_g3266 [Rubroshorea leprosula]
MVQTESSSSLVGLPLMDIALSAVPCLASLSLPSSSTSLSLASKSGSSLLSLPLVSNANVVSSVSIVLTIAPNGLDHSISTSKKSPHANYAPMTSPDVMLTKQGHETMPTTKPLGPTSSSSLSLSPNTQSPIAPKSSRTTISVMTAIFDVISALATLFSIKDLGLLRYFLGVEASYSTTGYITYLGANPTWRSCKQQAIARSFTKAEYCALAAASYESTSVWYLLSELGVTFFDPPTLFCDNIGATYLSSNLVMHSAMKHIAIDIHFVRDLVEEKVLHVSHISSCDQLADGLTKPFPSSHFLLLHTKIGVSNGSSTLQGRKEVNM